MNSENNVDTMKRIEEAERKTLENLEEKNKRAFVMLETIYLGKIKDKDVYRLAERDDLDNYTAVLYKYFDENAKVRGIKNVRPDGFEQWVYLDEEWEQLRDEIDKNEIQLQEEIDQILAQSGITKDEIDDITELDLEQEIKEQEIEEENEEEEELEQEEKRENNKEQKKHEQTSEYKDIEQEIDTSKVIDQRGTTLAKGLGLEEYSKILIVHSEKLSDIRDENGEREERTTKGLALLGVTVRDGKQVVEKIPQSKLDYYRGTNDTSVRFNDNDEVEKNSNVCEMFANPTTGKGLIIDRSQLEVNVYYQAGRTADSETAFAIQVDTERTKYMDAETRRIFNGNQGMYHFDEKDKEMEQHNEDKGEKIDKENADGQVDTISGHIHEINTVDDLIPYNGEFLKADEVADKMGIPTYIFINEYNKRAKELEGEDNIDLVEDLYDEIEDRAEERIENTPQKEKGGRTPGEDSRD